MGPHSDGEGGWLWSEFKFNDKVHGESEEGENGGEANNEGAF